MCSTKEILKLHLALCCLFILVPSALALAQDPSGRPKDAGKKKTGTRKPVVKTDSQPTVILTVLTDPPQSAVYINGERRGQTNADGRIQFEKLPVGHYSVEVRKEGYHPILRGFEAGSEEPTLVFKLEPNLEDYLKQFDALMSAGKLSGPESPNAIEFLDTLSKKFPGRPEVERLRVVLAAKFTEVVPPVVTHTVVDWRAVTRNELLQALNGLTNATMVKPDDTRFQAGAAYFRGVLALYDWQTSGRPQAGGASSGAGNLASARSELEKALSLQDSFAAARYQLGKVLLYSSDGAAAEASFLRASQAEPGWSQPRTGLGEAYYQMSKYKEAIDAFKKALEIEPKNATAQAGLGLARWSKGEKDGVKDLERAVQMDPGCAVAHLHLGTVYSQSKSKKDVAKAEGELKTAIQLNANNLEFANSDVEQRIADLKKKKK